MTTTSSEWQLKIKALFDASELQRGTSTAESSVKGLETQVERSTDSINQDLRAMDDGVSSSLGPSGSFNRDMAEGEDSVGRLKDSVGEIPGAMQDMADGASSAAAGLANAFASMGPLGIATGVVLSGFAVIAGKSKEVSDQIKSDAAAAFQSMKISATTSYREIARQAEKTADQMQFIADNQDKLTEAADATGVSIGTIVNLLTGRVNPQTKATVQLMEEANQKWKAQRGIADGQTQALQALYEWYQSTLKVQELQKREAQTYLQALLDQQAALKGTVGLARDLAGWMQTSESRAQGLANKLLSAQRYYGGLPQ